MRFSFGWTGRIWGEETVGEKATLNEFNDIFYRCLHNLCQSHNLCAYHVSLYAKDNRDRPTEYHRSLNGRIDNLQLFSSNVSCLRSVKKLQFIFVFFLEYSAMPPASIHIIMLYALLAC